MPAENHAIQREADRAYQAMCGPWFGATGPMQAYLRKYKDYLVQERIPADEKSDAQKLMQCKMVGIAADAYRSTAKHKAALEYLQVAEELYRAREGKPKCPAAGRASLSPPSDRMKRGLAVIAIGAFALGVAAQV